MSRRPPTVRQEQPDDVDAVRRVVAAAFGGERTPELLDALRDSVAWLDTLPGYDQTWMSGALVYPDVWWRQDAVGLRPER